MCRIVIWLQFIIIIMFKGQFFKKAVQVYIIGLLTFASKFRFILAILSGA